MDILNVLQAFSALSQETRLTVFRLLIKAGPKGMTAGDISKKLEVRQNTLSTNLSILLNADLIKNEREGRFIIYSVNNDGLKNLLAFLLEDCCGGQPEQCQTLINDISSACMKESCK